MVESRAERKMLRMKARGDGEEFDAVRVLVRHGFGGLVASSVGYSIGSIW